ncbi:hypothetical protein [Nesterenkonia suensis]
MICTYPGCDRPTQEYLCHDCTTGLADDINRIPDLVPVLQLIVTGEEKPFTQRTASGGGTGSGGGPREPINMSALSLLHNFQMVEPATTYARQADGARAKERIHAWVETADHMVNGADEDKPTPDYINYRLRDIHPMPVRHLIPWLREKTGINLTKQNIKDWARRGKLDRHNDTGHPTYHPADVLHAHHNDRRTT